MAIQKINLGTEPLGEGGDTYRSANTKINENFSNTDHAASRLVGMEDGQIPLAEDTLKASLSYIPEEIPSTKTLTGVFNTGEVFTVASAVEGYPFNSTQPALSQSFRVTGYGGTTRAQTLINSGGDLAIRGGWSGGVNPWNVYYHTGNTKKDSKTNLLLASSDSIPAGSAASRFVGTGEEQIPLNKNLGTAATKNTGIVSGDVALADHVFQLSSRPIRTQDMRGASYDLSSELFGSSNIAYLISNKTANSPITNPNALSVVRNFDIYNNLVRIQEAMPYNATTDRFHRVLQPSGTWTAWAKIYTNQNTNKGTNGVLSEKSPVTHLYHDRVEHTGDEKELEPIEFIKHGVGDYLLKNTTGLAQEGWYIVIPQDANGNPLIAVEYEDNDGDINVRTYKRKFDYEQAKVVADKDNPMDIPETRWIDLRFNDDPSLYDEEQLDESEPEAVEPEAVENPVEESE